MENTIKKKFQESPILSEKKDNLDTINLNRKKYTIGLIRALIFSSIALLIFFIPLQINGNSEILFGYLYNFLIDLFGIVGIWIITLLIVGNVLACFYGKFIDKSDGKISQYYRNETKIHFFIYVLGSVYAILYTLQVSFSQFNGPEFIVGDGTGGLMSGISLAVLWVIPLGAIFIPLLTNYGLIDFIGTLVEPIMRPVFKVPGKSAMDAIASFMTSSSVAVLITSKLYKANVYTKKESIIIATGFSAVSVGFAAVVIDTAGLMSHFVTVYFSALLIAFLISLIMARIPPISKMPDAYIDEQTQTEEERNGGKYKPDILKVAANRAIKKAYISDNFFEETRKSLMEGLSVLPKVLSMLFAIGVTFLIAAEYTPIFDIIGLLFAPILQLFNIPSAIEIAPAISLGIAEMFLPVLMIADSIATLDLGARYFITVVSMVQIIFFAETGSVILSTGLSVKVGQLILIFFLRTLIAIPIVAVFMHLLF